MIFAALAFGAATLVEVNVVVRTSSDHKPFISTVIRVALTVLVSMKCWSYWFC